MSDVTAHHGILRDVDLHVEDSGGQGRPVVLIHGWPLSGAAWEPQVGALAAAGYRVVAYDRRGFGRSDKPLTGYDYDTLTEDLHALVTGLHLDDATLVGFSMGGGEVARYLTRYGAERVRSVVFAAAVPPYLMRSADNPDGPLTQELADGLEAGLKADRESFFDEFMTGFFSAGDRLMVSEEQRRQAVGLCLQSEQRAALGCMAAWGTTDFRDDLPNVSVPALVLHGDSDGTVPFEGSGARTHAALPGSELHVIADGPHGINVSHAEEFNRVLLGFLAR